MPIADLPRVLAARVMPLPQAWLYYEKDGTIPAFVWEAAEVAAGGSSTI